MNAKLGLALVVCGIANLNLQAFAGCGEWDNRFGLPQDMTSYVYALAAWDPDGPGPQEERLVAGGAFTNAGGTDAARIAAWNGTTWEALGDGMPSGEVQLLTTWDPDGAGPQQVQLIAAGTFAVAGGVPVNQIARWDGVAWHAFGDGISTGNIFALTTWDSDGDGPEQSQLIVGGTFTVAGGVTVNRIARWDGFAWHPIANGFSASNSVVYALTTWDPDGDGPQASQLIAGGSLSINAKSVGGTARFDGSAWQPLGSGPGGRVVALTSWSRSGMHRLVAAGSLASNAPSSRNAVAVWDGTTWDNLGSSIPNDTSTARSIVTSDPDGSGPEDDVLLIGGTFRQIGAVQAYNIAKHDGTAWYAIGNGVSSQLNPVGALYGVFATSAWDHDHNDATPKELVSAGNILESGSVSLNYIAHWMESTWRPFVPGINFAVREAVVWDDDGAGPNQEQLVVVGSLTYAASVQLNGVGSWDGKQWQAIGTGLGITYSSLSVRDATPWDPDGDGPQSDQLAIAGLFNRAGGQPAGNVATWDGVQWNTLAGGTDSLIQQLGTWDPDGDGGAPAQLIVGGPFSIAGNTEARSIARWDGASWHPLGSGLRRDANDQGAGEVYAIAEWDPDADGPEPVNLVVGGSFRYAGGHPVTNLARWDGTDWHAMGNVFTQFVTGLAVLDPDGSGPLPEELYVGGSMNSSTGIIARWDGSALQQIGTNSNISMELSVLDLDGSGPEQAKLIAVGSFASINGIDTGAIAIWNGSTWQAFGDGTSRSIRRALRWRDQIAVAGGFTSLGGVAAGRVAIWSTLSPEITSQPSDESAELGATIKLLVAARNGQPMYQWLKGTVNLANGPSASGSTISGATTPSLTITNAQVSNSDDYDCVISNSCGSVMSDVAVVTVTPPPSCPADTNADNMVNSADLSVLLAQFGHSVSPGTGADFNSDGVVNSADLSILLANFGTSC